MQDALGGDEELPGVRGVLEEAVGGHPVDAVDLALIGDAAVVALHHARDGDAGHVARAGPLVGGIPHDLARVEGHPVGAGVGKEVVVPGRQFPGVAAVRAHEEAAQGLVRVGPVEGGLVRAVHAGKGAGPDHVRVVRIHEGEEGHGRVVRLQGARVGQGGPGFAVVQAPVDPVLLGGREDDPLADRVEAEVRDLEALGIGQAAALRDPLEEVRVVGEDAVAEGAGEQGARVGILGDDGQVRERAGDAVVEGGPGEAAVLAPVDGARDVVVLVFVQGEHVLVCEDPGDARVEGVRVGRIHDEGADLAVFVRDALGGEGPGFAVVRTLPDAVHGADEDDVAVPGVEDEGEGEQAEGTGGLVVLHGVPVVAAVDAFVDAEADHEELVRVVGGDVDLVAVAAPGAGGLPFVEVRRVGGGGRQGEEGREREVWKLERAGRQADQEQPREGEAEEDARGGAGTGAGAGAGLGRSGAAFGRAALSHGDGTPLSVGMNAGAG